MLWERERKQIPCGNDNKKGKSGKTVESLPLCCFLFPTSCFLPYPISSFQFSR
jgi:hypothetical protein